MIRRLAAVTLIVVVSTGGFGLCAGWTASAEARMACCASGSRCPMHTSESGRPDSPRTLTQVEADSCCAGSERTDSTAPVLAALLLPVALFSRLSILEPPDAVSIEPSRAAASIEIRHVPTHVLLNVFLI